MLEKHKKLEKNSVLLLIFSVIAVSIGGIVEIVPLFRMDVTIEKVEGMRPYTPLELMGQNIYIRENCNSCHSQQIRPLRDEVERYGHYSLAAESMYDHPFLWGSKRTGPDLARVGGKFSDEWHAAHLKNPRDVVPESIMPSYAFLANRGVNLTKIENHLGALRTVGVPYTDAMLEQAYNDAMAQGRADGNADGLRERYGDKVNVRDFDGQPNNLTEMDALIAYLQVLGTMADLRTYNPDIQEMKK
ncbi:MAG TPA: cytochrome-c oxidase, cbb3-type subunit II [Alphaproteobacteria bacterium]|nr:cytochrome-c oxidase, cbb3-type subunit II [Alphaproteobacteria bacterium]